MTQLFSTFDPANLGDALVLSSADQIVTYYVDGINIHRMARCLYAEQSYVSYAEFMVFGAGTLTGNCSIGIVNASAPLTKYVGQDANGWGLRPAEGAIYNNGSSVLSVSACAVNDIIGVMFAPVTNTVIFLKNGSVIGSIALPSTGSPAISGPWYLAASISGTLASPLSIFMNGGQQRFQYPQGSVTGWWIPLPRISSLAVATEDFITLPTDVNSSFVYDGAISPQSTTALNITREVDFWPWRTTSASHSGGQSYGNITIEDPNGNYDYLLQIDARDNPITITRVPAGGSVDSSGQIIATALVDKVESSGDFNKSIYVKDGLAILDKQAQASVFLPNVDISAQGRPRPIALGACRSVPAMLIDAATHTYAIHDSPVGQIASVRVAGKQLSPVGAPPDYTATSDYTGIVLNVDPAGIVTCDISSAYASVPSTPTDLLGGSGNFAAMTLSSQFTSNWLTRWNTLNIPHQPNAFWATSGGVGYVEFPYPGGDGYINSIISNTNIIQAGKTYAFVMTINYMPGVLLGAYNEPDNAYFWINGNNFGFPTDRWITPDGWYSQFPTPPGGRNVHSPQTVSTAFTNTQGVDLPLILAFQGNDGIPAFSYGIISSVYLYEISGPLTVVNLDGITLQQYCQHIIEYSANLPASLWNSTDAAAIDAATGYKSLGYFINQSTTVRNALQPALDSYGCDLYTDRSGTVRIARLIDPASVAPLGTIDESIIMGTPNGGGVTGSQQQSMIGISADLAPGLTNRFGARRNWRVFTDGDFGSTSLVDSPNSVRALLKLQYQAIAASGVQLSPTYLYAQQAQPLPSAFDDVAEAQEEVDRICSLYIKLRSFYYVPVKSDIADNYDIDQVWILKYPRYGLSQGKPVLIVGVYETPTQEQVTLKCWG